MAGVILATVSVALVAVDGIFGAKTKKAVETFQANTAGLTQTGR